MRDREQLVAMADGIQRRGRLLEWLLVLAGVSMAVPLTLLLAAVAPAEWIHPNGGGRSWEVFANAGRVVAAILALAVSSVAVSVGMRAVHRWKQDRVHRLRPAMFSRAPADAEDFSVGKR
jgi:hypothetical protein